MESLGIVCVLRVAKPVELVGSGERLIQGTETTTARQLCYEGSPVEPERLVVFAGKLVRPLHSKSPSILLATWWYCCGLDFSLILCAR